jgi:DNA-binding transcriptional LysR family regulator
LEARIASQIGAAIVPRWWSSIALAGVATRELALAELPGAHRLPLYVVWPRDIRDQIRDSVVAALVEGWTAIPATPDAEFG